MSTNLQGKNIKNLSDDELISEGLKRINEYEKVDDEIDELKTKIKKLERKKYKLWMKFGAVKSHLERRELIPKTKHKRLIIE